MKFTKMHGTGNDYIVVDCFEQTVDDPEALAKIISDRHYGIGGDGLILIRPTERAAVRMEMYNADGSRAQMCGNGIRCVAKYAYDHDIIRETIIPIDTDDGIKVARCTVAAGRVDTVRIDMGRPRFSAADIPLNADGEVIDASIEINGRTLRVTCLSMGNPHAVVFVDSLDSISLADDGSAMERHAMFPDRVNTHFVRIESRDTVSVLTWERGSGRTQACGTGVCAVCAAGARTHRTDRRITARVEGGELELLWSEDDHIFMTGPAAEVFSGEWPGRRGG